MRYALHIFPEFADAERVEAIRRQYDPLHGLIPPHITLVFPFEAEECEMMAALSKADHIAASFNCFMLEMQPVRQCGEYLFLLCKRGKEEVIRLHDELYKTAFAAWYAPEFAYEPHLTLGRGSDLPQIRMEKPLCCIVRQVVLERIEKDERSTVIRILHLKED